MISSSQRYISRELTHFVGRGLDEESQYSLLMEIFRSGWLTHAPHDRRFHGNLQIKSNAKISQNEMYTPQMICFCDIPIPDFSIHIKKYSHFALSFDKGFIIEKGGCPVHYIPRYSKVRSGLRKDLTPDQMMEALVKEGPDAIEYHIEKGEYFDIIIKKYRNMIERLIMDDSYRDIFNIGEIDRFLSFHIFSYLKFFDHSHPEEHTENFYFEREWRVIGNIKFSKGDVRTILIPKRYANRFRDDFHEYNGQLIFID